MTPQYLNIDGTRIAIHQSNGAGPPALLIHGNSASSQSFQHQLEGPLGAAFKLYAIDLPGHGQSDNAADPTGTYSLPGYARVIVEAARQLGIADAVFVGWSLGGHILLEACPELPDAAGFCIFGTPPLDSMAAMAQGFLPDPAMGILFQEQLNEEEIQMRVAGMFQPGMQLPEVFIEDVRRSDGHFRTALLNSLTTVGFRDEVEVVGKLTQPLAVIHGGRERLVNGDYIASVNIPTLWRGAVQIIPEASHTPQWETPEQFDALLETFLRETSARSHK